MVVLQKLIINLFVLSQSMNPFSMRAWHSTQQLIFVCSIQNKFVRELLSLRIDIQNCFHILPNWDYNLVEKFNYKIIEDVF